MTIEKAPAMPPAQAEFREDLLGLADYAFHTAQTLCGDCTDYHALFGYGRLAGLHDGIDRDEEVLAPRLAALSPPGAKLLIACCADAGLLAMTARATTTQAPAITVADRCATPLAVCRRFAQTENLPVRTIQNDFSRAALSEPPHDVALAHNVLLFVPESLQVPFLQNIGLSLAESGVLVLVTRGTLPQRGEKIPSLYRTHTKIIAALAARNLPLPEDEARFRQRLEHLDESRRPVAGMQLDRERIEAMLAAAGFHGIECATHERRRSDDGSETVPTFIFVASVQRR